MRWNPAREDIDRLFEEILDKYERKIFNMIYRMVGDYEEAVDLTQETFLRVYKGLKGFRGESKISTWVYQIALNVCRTKMAYARKKAGMVSLNEAVKTEEGELEREVADETLSPERVLEREALQELVQKAIASLPPPYREVIILRDIQGLSYEEIADITSTNEQTVRVRLHRARQALKKILEPYIEGG